MNSKRIPLLSSLMQCVTIALVGAVAVMILHSYLSGPAGGSFDLRSIHYTFKALHHEGRVFYSLIALALASWLLRPSPRTSSRGR